MLSSKSYLLQALYQWILDSDCTPHIVVDATVRGVLVPSHYVKDGQIVLNILPSAVKHLNISKQAVAFSARFSGASMDIYLPLHAIMGIYARENGRGMMFEPEDAPDPEITRPPDGGAGKARTALRVVK